MWMHSAAVWNKNSSVGNSFLKEQKIDCDIWNLSIKNIVWGLAFD